jgi:hypothetical protein
MASSPEWPGTEEFWQHTLPGLLNLSIPEFKEYLREHPGSNVLDIFADAAAEAVPFSPVDRSFGKQDAIRYAMQYTLDWLTRGREHAKERSEIQGLSQGTAKHIQDWVSLTIPRFFDRMSGLRKGPRGISVGDAVSFVYEELRHRPMWDLEKPFKLTDSQVTSAQEKLHLPPLARPNIRVPYLSELGNLRIISLEKAAGLGKVIDLIANQAANAVRFPGKDSGASAKREAVQYAVQSTLMQMIGGFPYSGLMRDLLSEILEGFTGRQAAKSGPPVDPAPKSIQAWAKLTVQKLGTQMQVPARGNARVRDVVSFVLEELEKRPIKANPRSVPEPFRLTKAQVAAAQKELTSPRLHAGQRQTP